MTPLSITGGDVVMLKNILIRWSKMENNSIPLNSCIDNIVIPVEVKEKKRNIIY